MKKVIYVFLWFCLYLQGCEQKVEYQYDDVNRIYFQYEVLNSLGNKVSLDSFFLLENFRMTLLQIRLK